MVCFERTNLLINAISQDMLLVVNDGFDKRTFLMGHDTNLNDYDHVACT